MEESINTIRPLFQSCFERLTADQWHLVASGRPDINTKHILAHMLVKVLGDLSGVWSNPGVKRNRLHESVNSSVTLSIKETLGIKSVYSPSTDKLTELISTEVEDLVKTPRTQTRITTPHRLNAMIILLCNILEAMAGKQKKQAKVKQSIFRRKQTTPRQSTQSVQDIILDEVNQILKPILDDMSRTEYKMLKEEFSADIADIARTVTESMRPQGTGGPKSPQQSHRLVQVNVKICDFFAKMFIRASMCQITSQIKAKFTREAKVTDSESFRSLMVDVEYVLRTTDETTLSAQTWQLSTLLYTHVTGQTRQARRRAPVSVPRRHYSMYLDIRGRVIRFLSLFWWWLSNQVISTVQCSI
ncbi:uncharacterized protein LOC131466876 [Solea solea]|uniref:uncharacterized protein LOC131466876 n=1 Tax=Solea solea TaxID=90069 RepID=UPI00272BD277|nr:uncharacterized protein LOC131466876 [Solea solea]